MVFGVTCCYCWHFVTEGTTHANSLFSLLNSNASFSLLIYYMCLVCVHVKIIQIEQTGQVMIMLFYVFMKFWVINVQFEKAWRKKTLHHSFCSYIDLNSSALVPILLFRPLWTCSRILPLPICFLLLLLIPSSPSLSPLSLLLSLLALR